MRGKLDGATDASDHRSRTGGGIPRPWAILAVVLGLMALVSALSASTSNRLPYRGAPAERLASATTTTTARVALDPPTTTVPITTTTLADGTGPLGAGGGDVDRVTTPAPTTVGISTSPSDVIAPTTPTTPSATVPAPSVPSLVPGSTPALTVAAPYPGPGNIAYPTVSATYPAGAGATVAASVTWADGTTLSLSATCPGATSHTASGSSPLAVSTGADGSTTCTVTLRVVSFSWGAGSSVSYTLSITPAIVG